MYAVIRRYTTHSGMVDRIVQAVNDGFRPQVQRLPGFVAYYLVDAGNDTIASVGVFESRESADESTRIASEWVRRNIAALIRTSPVILGGEVRSQARIEQLTASGSSRVASSRSSANETEAPHVG